MAFLFYINEIFSTNKNGAQHENKSKMKSDLSSHDKFVNIMLEKKEDDLYAIAS